MEKVTINNETIYLKKNFLGWHTIYPIRNEDNSINWKNLIAGGSWINLIAIIIFVIICVGAIIEVSSIMKTANECLASKIPIRINPLSNLTIPKWNLS
jgi:hypothetical protein